jgi:hypothetical protein
MPRFGAALDLANLSAAPANPASGRNLLYVRADVPRLLTSTGAEKTLAAPQFARKTADQSFTSASLADVTGLTWPVKAGVRYAFDIRGGFSAALSTTGLVLSVNGPTLGSDGLLANLTISTSSTALVNGTITAYDTATTGTGSSGTLPWWINGAVHVSADGTFAVRAATEVAASAATVKVNSYGLLWQVG